MPELSEIVETLRAQEQELEAQLAKVRTAREALENVTSPTVPARRGRPPGSRAAKRASGASSNNSGRRRTLSAATRAKMAAAQRARWAKQGTKQGR